MTAVWLIGGPTGSGKSAIALRLARDHGGEIVNADSMQLYADLRILTARPTPHEEALAPHHLYGVADAADGWSVGRWLTEARAALADIAERGAQAIVVGGTGLYFRALTHGLADIPSTPPAVRAQVAADFETLGEVAFRERLTRADPAAAARIAVGDRQRLTRALEVFEASGRSLTDWRSATSPTLPPGGWRGIVLAPPRAALYRTCDERLAAMVEAGVLGEVSALMARHLSPRLPAMKTLGLSSFAGVLEGTLTPAEALARAQLETRRYAKRQITWFRGQAPDWPRTESAEGVQLFR